MGQGLHGGCVPLDERLDALLDVLGLRAEVQQLRDGLGNERRVRQRLARFHDANDWKAGASYTVPDGLFKNVEVGAYYSGNNANSAAYTDTTGYNTAKDTVVAYIKKTF